jgi:hypothetical protein
MVFAIAATNRSSGLETIALMLTLCLGISSSAIGSARAESSTDGTATTTPAAGKQGLTPETAIPLVGYETTMAGIDAEYAYLDRTYPGWSLIHQAIMKQGDRVYDVMNIKLPGGEERDIYFDITTWYGAPL